MSFALTYGSFGDLLETAKLAVKVVKLLRDGAHGKLSQERLALAVELQTLNSDLITLDFIASAFHLDTSSTRSLVVLRIRSEVESCRILLTQFLAKLKAPRSFLGTIIGALSEESELAEFRTKISRPLKAIRTLMAMLNLSMSQGIGMEVEHMGSQILQVLGSQVVQVGERFDHFGDRLAAYHEAVMNRPIPRAVVDDIFCVVDPAGGDIPISLRYCRVYTDLDRLIKAHLLNRPEAGARYIERGDYNIVSSEGSVVAPVDFTRTIRAGMQVEMSIVKRQIQNERNETWNTQCPHCHHQNPSNTGNDWFKCVNPACGRKHKINEQEVEEIMSPQTLHEVEAEPELFRLVHIYTVYPPLWLLNAIQAIKAEWNNELFEVILKSVAKSPAQWRIKCLDCPGKLYITGPDNTLENYKWHLKNRLHRQRVNDRIESRIV